MLLRMPMEICRTGVRTMGWAASSSLGVMLLMGLWTSYAGGQEPVRAAVGQQVVLVTGSTSGLGREVALRMGALGAHVIVHGRNEERGAQVVSEIMAAGPGSARFYRADFASFEQVRTLAEVLLQDYDRLDVLVNNAGFGSAPDERLISEDGHEFRFQVNYLSPFLLTHMLMPHLRVGQSARIVNVSSLAANPIDFDDVMIQNDFSGRRAYGQSKLALVMFTFDLSEDLAGTGITANALHPATYMPTGMVSRLGVEPRATIDEGALAVMQLITSNEIDGGQFFIGLNPGRANAQAYDLEARARLRSLSEALTRAGDVPSAPANRPGDVPALHHAGLNSVDPEAAIDWYLRIWPTAERTEVDGKPAVASEMYLILTAVDDPPGGAFDSVLGRPEVQSAFWHIGAFANTTDMDRGLDAVGITHLPLYTDAAGAETVWRSGLAPYAGTRTAEQLVTTEPTEPRAGGFSYVLAPDGVLFELTGGANTTESMSHIHLFHEQPQCAANWYSAFLGMALPSIRNEDGSRSERSAYDPCEGALGEAGWPSLEPIGTIRQPRATVTHGSGSISSYPRQCVLGRCGQDQPLAPSRGQALDHVAFTVESLDAWYAWLESSGVVIIEAPHAFGNTRAFMIEGPDRLAIELLEAAGAPPVRLPVAG